MTKILLVITLSPIDALDGAGIDHRRMAAWVEVLGFMDVSKRHIVQARVFHQRAGQHQVAAQHDGALTAIAGSGYRGVCSHHGGQGGIGLLQPTLDELRQQIFQLLIHLAQVGSRGIALCQVAGAGDPGQCEHLQGQVE